MQDRDRNLRLELGHTDAGEDYITVMPARGKGDEDPLWTIRRAETGAGKPCWIVHTDGPLYEFKAIVDGRQLPCLWGCAALPAELDERAE